MPPAGNACYIRSCSLAAAEPWVSYLVWRCLGQAMKGSGRLSLRQQEILRVQELLMIIVVTTNLLRVYASTCVLNSSCICHLAPLFGCPRILYLVQDRVCSFSSSQAPPPHVCCHRTAKLTGYGAHPALAVPFSSTVSRISLISE